MKFPCYCLLLLLSLSVTVDAQNPLPFEGMEGYWTGAFIRSGNSVQIVNAEVYPQGDSMVIAPYLPDWVYYPPQPTRLLIEDHQVRFQTYYGLAELRLDTNYLEITGSVSQATPPLTIHLKKSRRPYSRQVESKDLTVLNKGANVSGTLYYPANVSRPLACAVFVHGRGCGTRNWNRSRAKLLAEYGIATFVYDKRGSEPSGFPCTEATHDLNVSDVSKVVAVLAAEDRVDPDNIGLISYSAGGWIASHITQRSEVDIAFLITVVGPTTSVMDQQLDGLEAYLKEAGYGTAAIAEAKEYTRLLFDTQNPVQSYDRLQVLADSAKSKGWDRWLVEDDYVSSPDAFDELWVQRFSYDPAAALKAYTGPYLAIFGEKDLVVPYQIQIDRLQALMQEAGKTTYSYEVVRSAGHGLEHGHELRNLGQTQGAISPAYYFKYDRVAYGAIQYMIDFLKKNEFLSD